MCTQFLRAQKLLWQRQMNVQTRKFVYVQQSAQHILPHSYTHTHTNWVKPRRVEKSQANLLCKFFHLNISLVVCPSFSLSVCVYVDSYFFFALRPFQPLLWTIFNYLALVLIASDGFSLFYFNFFHCCCFRCLSFDAYSIVFINHTDIVGFILLRTGFCRQSSCGTRRFVRSWTFVPKQISFLLACWCAILFLFVCLLVAFYCYYYLLLLLLLSLKILRHCLNGLSVIFVFFVGMAKFAQMDNTSLVCCWII